MNLNKKVLFSIFSLIIWLLIWVFLFSHLEQWNYIQSFYFSVVTLATVWYWDLSPTNDLSRLFISFYIIIWTWIVVSSIWIISSAIISKKEERLFKQYKEIRKTFKAKK